jgi:hypothetical protein
MSSVTSEPSTGQLSLAWGPPTKLPIGQQPSENRIVEVIVNRARQIAKDVIAVNLGLHGERTIAERHRAWGEAGISFVEVVLDCIEEADQEQQEKIRFLLEEANFRQVHLDLDQGTPEPPA